jgi:hypothetical protein
MSNDNKVISILLGMDCGILYGITNFFVEHFPASEQKVCYIREQKTDPASENEMGIRKCHLQEKPFFLLFA